MKATKYPFFILFLSLLIGDFSLANEQKLALSLADCVQLMLKNNHIIKSFEQAVISADYGRKSQRSAFLPSLSMSGNYTILDEAPTISISGGFIPSPEPITMKVSDKETYSIGLKLTQPLFTGGALRNAYKKSTLEVEAAKISAEKTKAELIYRVHQAYFGLLMAFKLHQVSLQGVKTLQAHLEMAKNFYDSGIVPKNDLLKVEVQLADVLHKSIKAENGIEMAKTALITLVGIDHQTDFDLSDQLSFSPFDKDLPSCYQIALDHRPDLKELLVQRNILDATRKMVKSQFFPALALVGSYNWNKEELSWEIDRVASITAAISWDIFSWGKTYYQANQLEYQLKRLEEIIEQQKATVEMEVKSAYLKLKEAEKGIAVSEKAIDQAEENLRISEDRYKQAVATSTEVLDAETQLSQARTNYYSSLYDYNLARAALLLAMGIIDQEFAQ